MKLTVNANSIIDSLIPELDVIQERYEKIPRGSFIDNNSEYRRIYDKANQAERAFTFASDILGVNQNALYEAVLVARKWYIKTDWQKCLPDDDADRLLACMIEQNAKDRQYSKDGGNEYMIFMQKVISDWAKRSMKRKTAA